MMKAFRYLSVGLCALGMHAADVAAVPVHYVSSGALDYVQDQNAFLDLLGEQPAYPQGIGPGTPFSISMTLDGNLNEFTGYADFDFGGIYQGHIDVRGRGLVCGDNGGYTCANFGDSDLPWLKEVSIVGESAAPTNLPVAYLNGGNWLYWFALELPTNTPRPISADTPLTDLPVASMSLWLWSGYSTTHEGPCPAGFESFCSIGDPVLYNVTQGWSIDGTPTTLAAVPLPSAAWLFGSGVIGLTGARLRKVKSERR
jgi:hypothetical protein